MDVIFVVCVKLSCIQPYLVVKFRSTFNCLSIQVFSFVVSSCIDIWIGVCFTIFICQFRIVINELRTCDIEFRFRNNVFLWLELRFCWWCYGIVKFFIGSICNSCYDCFRSTVVRNHNFHSRNHWVVSNGTISTTNFFYSVVISLTKIIATKLKCLEVYFTTCIIVNTFNFCTIFLQDEFEFVSLKRTSSKSLREFKIKWNWNTVDTFLSWFVWFFNCLAHWVVNVNCLVSCIFNISTSRNRCFNSCWNIKFIVTTKFELSCIDNWIVYFIFDEICFRSCSDGTIFNCDVELVRHICTRN